MIATRFELLNEITSAGGCSHPIRLKGEFVNLATGEISQRQIRLACKDRRIVVCPSCSYLYKADAWIVVSAGMVGGKGVPESVSSHPRLFMTLTAPSFGPVHVRLSDGSCRTKGPRTCSHGQVVTCAIRHDPESPILGTPVCARCFDYRGAVLWNAQSARLWNRTIEQARRRLALDVGIAPNEFRRHARLSYLKVAEFQRRGLAHFHVVLRADGPGDPFTPPPSFLTTTRLTDIIADVIAEFRVVGVDQQLVTWGAQFKIGDASNLERDDQRIASYIAKYSTKSSDGSVDFARRFRSRRDIRGLVGDSHHKQLALTTWDLALEPNLDDMKLRLHAHAFGFRGQYITKSHCFSTRFGDLREARATCMAAPGSDDPVAGSFTYEGRGYDDPRASGLAALLHEATVEVRIATRTAASASHGISRGTSPGGTTDG
jgi:hypothetical protein